MPYCNDVCAIRPPQGVSAGCKTDIRPGGIARVVFAQCNVSFRNILDPAEWCDKVERGQIVSTLEVMGQKPKGSPTKKRLSSCASEAVIGWERSITFMDNNADDVNFTDFSFYNEIQRNTQAYQFGYLTCDGLFYGFIPKFVIEADLVIEQTNTGNSFLDVSIMWTGFDNIVPIVVPDLGQILAGACTGIGGYNSCADDFVIRNPSGRTILCDDEPLTLEAPYFVGASYQWYDDASPITGATGPTLDVGQFTEFGPNVISVQYRRRGCANTTTTTGITITDNRPIPSQYGNIAIQTSPGPNGINVTLQNLNPGYTFRFRRGNSPTWSAFTANTTNFITNGFVGEDIEIQVRNQTTFCISRIEVFEIL